MTAKEIYESIDLAQVPDDLAGKLRQIEKGTKGFTIQSDKVDTFMSGVYKKLKEKRPTALKNLKVEEKVTKTEVKKGDTTQVVEDLEYKVKGTKKVTKKTPTPSKPKKSTWLGEVKKRKKKGEKWEDAKARIKKELDEERAKAKADAEKVVSQTSQALKNLEKMLAEDPKLAGYPRTYGSQSKKIDAAKDAKIKAMPAGKRVSKKGHKNQYGESKGGRVYWENRDNRSDRYAPNFPNKVYLEVGGETDDLGFPFGHTYLVVEVSPSGDKKMIKQTKDYITALTSSAVARAAKSSKDARVVIVDLEEKRVIHEAFEAGGEITITPTQLINNPDALVGTTTMTELFECGGVTAYQEGGEVFVTPYPLTNAGSADYVAGSNTMSNMFEFGGSVDDIEFENEENEAIGRFLLTTSEGKEIWNSSSNSGEFEKKIRAYHGSKGLPNWMFDDGDDDGIDYVTFGDLWSNKELREAMKKMSNGGNVSVSKKGKKRFRQQNGIGKSKYTISYHDGAKKHKDGSDFFDIKIFKNKKDVDAFKKTLLQKGFVEEYENGGEVGDVYVVETRYKGLPLNESLLGNLVLSEETLDKLEEDFAQDISFTPIQDSKMKPMSYAVAKAHIGFHAKNFKGLSLAKGGYVVVGEKDGFWTIVSTPTTKEKAKELLDMTTLPKGEKGKIVSVDEAMSRKNVLGKEYLESGGTIVAADPSAAMEDLNQTYGYESVYAKGGVTPKAHIQKLANDLWDRKGYDLTYLEKLSEKELKSLWDTEFFYEDEFFEKGGRLGFDGLAKKVAKRYEGKPVKAKYQKEYGKTYSKEEAMEVGRKVAAKVYGQQQAKMEMGGEITQPYSLINAGSAEYVAGSNTMSNMFEKGGSVQGHLYEADKHLREAGTKLWENKNPKEAKFRKAYNDFDENLYDLFTRRELSELGYAKGGSLGFSASEKIAEMAFGSEAYNAILMGLQKPMKGGKALNGIQAKKLADEFALMALMEKQAKYSGRNSFPVTFTEAEYAKGGSLMGHGLEVGDKIVKDLGSALKVSTKDGAIVYVDLASGYRDKDMPLPFAKGGDIQMGEIAMLAKENNALGHEVVKKISAGADVEMEHTEDQKFAMRIALDHLKEDYNYYEKLKKLGL